MAPPRTTTTTTTITMRTALALPLLGLGLLLLALLPAPARGNAPCSLPLNSRRGAAAAANGGGGGCKGAGPCGAAGGGGGGRYWQSAYECQGTKASKCGMASRNVPLASFRHPQQSLERLRGVAEKVKGKVGGALGQVKEKWAAHRSARRARKQQQGQAAPPAPKRSGNGGGGLFRLSPPAPCDPDDEECAPGQDVSHLHEHPQHHHLEKQQQLLQPRHHHYNHNGRAPPHSLRRGADGEDDLGAALVVLGRTQSYDAVALLREEARQVAARRGRGRGRALTYGHWAVDFLAFGVKLIAIMLFQVLGTALVVNEYSSTGLVSKTLIKFSSLLAGLAFLPPLMVALRESLPSHSRNPLVRGVSRLFELGLDVVSVSALALLASVLLTAVCALPGWDFLVSHQLGEEYIKGALSAAIVMAFIWAFAKAFEPVATKHFM